ncbi:MAG: gephyrin-like molybdotransferase Glp [Candidatus Limnocylindrales bacterium]
MSAPDLLPLDEARARILEDVLPLRGGSTPLAEALGRVLAEDAHALITLPPWDNSAMDGYAVRSEDVREATPESPVTLAVVGEVAAGHEPEAGVGERQAMRVLTGGMMPAGADAVVKVEDTDAPAGVAELPQAVAVHVAVGPGKDVRAAGSDMHQGDHLLDAGARISPAAVAVLAAAGHARVNVHRVPRVGVIATGDELTPLGQPLGPASIPDSNSESIAAQIAAAGGQPVRLGIAIDDREIVRERLLEGVRDCDVLVVTGGVSVGAHDLVKEVFAEIGTLDLWRVAIQPGKPLAYGSAPRPDGGYCLLFGLPGNPVSSFVTFELFVRPVVRRLRGDPADQGRIHARATLAETVRKSAPRRAFVRVTLEADDAGRLQAHLAGGQGSHVLSALAQADALAVIEEGPAEVPAGTEVEVIRLDVEVA